VLAGQGFIFEGLNHTSYKVEYTENDACMSHYTLERVLSLSETSKELTLEQLLAQARRDLGSRQVVLEFSRDVIHKLSCGGCGQEEELFVPVGTVAYARGKCPECGTMRAVITAHSYSGAEPYGKLA